VALVREALGQALAAHPVAEETETLKRELLGLALDADLVLDLHCAGEALQHLYASRWQREDAVVLGADLGCAAILLDEGPGGTPFDDACNGPWWQLRQALPADVALPLACFAVTVELRGQTDVSDAYAAADSAALVRFLQRRGVLAGDPGALPEPHCEATALEAVDVLTAPAAGVVVYHKQLGETVAAGELVAEIVSPLGEPLGAARAPIRSATSGLFFNRKMGRLVRPGQKLCMVAGREPLDYRKPGNLLGD
jgi:predicted deacylase